MSAVDEIESIVRNKISAGILCDHNDFMEQSDLSGHFLDFSFLHQYINNNLNEIIVAESILTKPESKTSNNPFSANFWQLCLEHLCLSCEIFWNYTHPYVSFDYNIEDKKCRITLIHHSCLNSQYSRMFIRFFQHHITSINYFSKDSDLNEFIKLQVKQKSNILIAGATGSGKTTFLNTLIGNIELNEHIVAIEDTKELKLPITSSSFIASEDKNFTMNDYMKYAMRMSPDRIIIGEMRSSEIITFLLALNTGHSGCLSTIHANSAIDAIDRMCLLFNIYNETDLSFATLKKLIANSIDYIVFLKDKKVFEVIKILGSEQERVFTDIIYNISGDSVLN